MSVNAFVDAKEKLSQILKEVDSQISERLLALNFKEARVIISKHNTYRVKVLSHREDFHIIPESAGLYRFSTNGYIGLVMGYRTVELVYIGDPDQFVLNLVDLLQLGHIIENGQSIDYNLVTATRSFTQICKKEEDRRD
jgi:hypothetical protein